jgi:hypothetical protein
MTRLRSAVAFVAALSIAGLACSTNLTSIGRILSMHLVLPSTTLTVGQKATATVVVQDDAGNLVTPGAVSWSSSNPAVASVTAAEVTALSAGTTLISAASEGLSDTTTLVVTNPPTVPVASVSVALNASTLQAGQSTQATATTRDASGAVLTGRSITWSSDNTNAATVSSSGLVMGVGAGTAQISATSEGKSGAASVQVSSAPTVGPPTQLVIAVQPAGAVSGLALTTQPAVQVRDAAGVFVSSATNQVTVSIASGSGTLIGTKTVAAVNGVANFSGLRIDGSGAHTLAFSATGLTGATAGSLTVTQTPASLSLQTQPAGATTGQPLTTQPVVRILDNAGLLITSSTLAVTSTVASGTATVTGGSAAAAGGVATFTNLRLDGSGSVTLRFQTATPALQVVSAAVPVAAGAGAKLSLTTQPSSTAIVGAAFASQPVVQLRDAGNNAVLQAGVNVTAAIATGGGTLGGTVTVATNASGVASFSNLSIGGTSGPRTLSFSAPGLTSVTSNAVTVSSPATQLAITTQPSATVTSGLPFAQQPVIALRDAANVAAGQAGVVVTAAIASGGGTLGGTLTATTNSGGVATFTGLSISGSGTVTLAFTSPGLASVSSNTLTIVPPVAGSAEPVYDPSNQSLILTDNFDQYATKTAMMNAYPVDRNFLEYGEIIAGRGGAGKAARLNYGIGAADDIVFGPEGQLGSVGAWNGTLPQKAGPYKHLFFSTWFRVSAGADPAQNDVSGVKGFMFWHTGNQRYQNAVNTWSHPDDITRGPKGANPDNGTSGMNLYKTADGKAPLWSQFANGQWHRFTIEIYAGNDPSGHFGERYWVDGVLLYSDLDLKVGTGTKADHYDYEYPIMHWSVFGNFTTPAARSNFFTFDVDDWMAWTQ